MATYSTPGAIGRKMAPQMFPQMGATSGQPNTQTLAQGLGVTPTGGTMAFPGMTGSPTTMGPQTGVTTSNFAMPGATMQPQTGATTFSQGSNLIGSQFSPTASPRLGTFQGMADQAAQRYAGLGSQQNIGALRGGMQGGLAEAMGAKGFQYQGINPSAFAIGGMPGLGDEAQKLRGFVMDDLSKVREGADRGKLAADAFDLTRQRSEPEFQQRVRQLGQNTAALGRIGSGIYGSNLTDLNAERERELSLTGKELANSAAGQTLADRMGILDATRGVSGDVTSQDTARQASYNNSMGNAYDRARDERDFQFDVQRYNDDLAFRRGGFQQDTARGVFGSEGEFDDRGFGQARSRAGDLSGYARDIEGSERQNRDELRGERGYQYGLERDAQDDQYRRRGFEEDLVDRSMDRDVRQRTVEDALFGNQFDRSRQLYGMGTQGDVTGQYNRQSQRYDQQSADAGDAFAELMKSYGLRKQGPQAPQMPANLPNDDFYRLIGGQIDRRIPSNVYGG